MGFLQYFRKIRPPIDWQRQNDLLFLEEQKGLAGLDRLPVEVGYLRAWILLGARRGGYFVDFPTLQPLLAEKEDMAWRHGFRNDLFRIPWAMHEMEVALQHASDALSCRSYVTKPSVLARAVFDIESVSLPWTAARVLYYEDHIDSFHEDYSIPGLLRRKRYDRFLVFLDDHDRVVAVEIDVERRSQAPEVVREGLAFFAEERRSCEIGVRFDVAPIAAACRPWL